MTDDPIPSPSRRTLAWVAIGAVALGVAGGGAAAVALGGGSEPERLAVATAAEDEGGTDGSTPATEDGTAEEGAADEGADCAGGAHRRPGAHGTVTGVDGTTITVEGAEGTATTVTTDDETTVLDVAEGEVADVAEGDTVVVMGETADDGTVTARHLSDLGSLDPADLRPDRSGTAEGEDDDEGDRPEPPEGAGRFRPTTGTVASIDGSSITVTTDDGDVVVATDDETAVTVVSEIAVSDLAEGDTVAARGETDDEGTVAADVVIRGELDGRGPGGFGFGDPGGPGFGGPGGHGRPRG